MANDDNLDAESAAAQAEAFPNAEGLGEAGSSRSLEDVTFAELIAFPSKGERPDWMVTRFPVSHAEYDEMLQAANVAEPIMAAAAVVGGEEIVNADTADDDEGALAAMAVDVEFDPPEDAMAAAAEPVANAPAIGGTFSGIPQTRFIPPDCTCAVGPDDVLVALNTDLAVYRKNGQLRFRWPNMTSLFGSVLPSGVNLFDPKVAYDHYERRWLVIAVARRANPRGSWLLVAASQSSDPGGRWWVWSVDASVNGSQATNNWADYPALGFDTQAVYVTFNMFQFNGGFQYTKLRILRKSELYAGSSIQWHDFWDLKNTDGTSAFTIQPCIHYRGTGGNPPAYMVNSRFGPGNSLTMWTVSNPLGIWSGGTASVSRVNVPCQSYDLGPDALQDGTTTRIDSGDTRLQNAIYQNVGGTRRIWTAHTVKHTWPGESVARSAIGTYEIDVAGQKIEHQKRYGARGKYYYYPAVQTDISRNAYLVFARSNSSQFVELRQTGSRVTSADRTWEGSRQIKAGESTYIRKDSNGRNRWGDYFGICRDGGDSSTVWMYGEYAESSNSWGTWVASASY